MRKLCATIATATALVANQAGAEECRSLVKSTTIEASVHSGYLSPFGALYSRNPILQTSYTLALCNGVYANLWHSLDLKAGPNIGSGDEIDMTLGWSGNIGSSGFSLDLGAVHYNVPPLSRVGREDYIAPYLELTAPEQEFGNHRWAPYVRLEAYRDMARGAVANFQPFIYAGVKDEWTLDEQWSVSHKLYGLHNPKALDLRPAFIGKYEGALKYRLSQNVTLGIPVAHLSLPFGNPGDGRTPAVVVGAGISISF